MERKKVIIEKECGDLWKEAGEEIDTYARILLSTVNSWLSLNALTITISSYQVPKNISAVLLEINSSLSRLSDSTSDKINEEVRNAKPHKENKAKGDLTWQRQQMMDI